MKTMREHSARSLRGKEVVSQEFRFMVKAEAAWGPKGRKARKLM